MCRRDIRRCRIRRNRECRIRLSHIRRSRGCRTRYLRDTRRCLMVLRSTRRNRHLRHRRSFRPLPRRQCQPRSRRPRMTIRSERSRNLNPLRVLCRRRLRCSRPTRCGSRSRNQRERNLGKRSRSNWRRSSRSACWSWRASCSSRWTDVRRRSARGRAKWSRRIPASPAMKSASHFRGSRRCPSVPRRVRRST